MREARWPESLVLQQGSLLDDSCHMSHVQPISHQYLTPR